MEVKPLLENFIKLFFDFFFFFFLKDRGKGGGTTGGEIEKNNRFGKII